ncbi:hypothetical protein ACILE2_01600 [Capnocytophaga canimorsus]|uniref:hypothetical protein n=1 Tax=Capnocytophaga canimorsus TaxID=28188 RepID=UPI0037D47F2C
MADVIDEFDKLMAQRIKKAVPQQVQWAKVTSVNWDEKTCEATDLDTDLPFLGVSLGIGSMHVKPKVGSLILVGLIENSETKPFLLQAEAIEEYEIKATKIDLKNDEIVFKTLLNELLTELKNAIIQTPSGPGNFAPNNVAKFEEINGKINQLFK